VPRDDELYALAADDARIFFPGGHAGKARAVQALLNPGYRATWTDRSDGKRSCGFVVVRHDEGDWWHLERVPAAAFRVASGAGAWKLLVEAIDPELLGDVDARLFERPMSREDAVSLASAPETMRRAEALVREAIARGAALGGGACPPIVWRALPIDACARATPIRSAFDGRWQLYREALGGQWSTHLNKGRDMFAFSRSSEPPPLLKFAAEDCGEALTFDALRSQGFVSGSGVAFAGLDNPFESLLRIGREGVVVQEVSPTRVVLGTCD
jgi:hypothetical protein